MALPPDLQTGRVEGHLVDSSGTPATGHVTLTQRPPLIVAPTSKMIVLRRPIEMILDANGVFGGDVPATNDPDVSPIGWTYQVELHIVGVSDSHHHDIEVPVGATVDLSGTIEAVPGSGTSQTTFRLVPDATAVPNGSFAAVSGGAWVARTPAEVRTAIGAEIAGTAQVKADAAEAAAITVASNEPLWLNPRVVPGGAIVVEETFAQGGGDSTVALGFSTEWYSVYQATIPDDWTAVDAYLWWIHKDPDPAASWVLHGATGITEPGSPPSRSYGRPGLTTIVVGAPGLMNRVALGTLTAPTAKRMWSAFLAVKNAGTPTAMTTNVGIIGVELRKAGT